MKSSLIFFVIALALASSLPRSASAHEGHDNLPSTGVTVRGNRVLISPQAEKSLGLTTTVIHLQDLEQDVRANGSVEVPWRQHAFATTLSGGRVERVLVQAGEQVEAGQELARIESTEVETAQLDLLKAASALELAGRMVTQREALFRNGNIAERRLLESQADRDHWTAERGIAWRKLLALGLNSKTLDNVLTTGKPVRTVPVISPIRGVVSAAEVRVGQVVQPWQQIYEIVDLSTLWVHGQILESDCLAVAEGDRVSITFDALPGETFEGRIDHLGVKLDPELHAQHVHVAVDNPDGKLRAGMFGRLKVRARVVRDAVACPIDAIIERGDQSYVLVQERAGEYICQQVTLGLRSGKMVEVTDGLFPGDPIVKLGKRELASLLPAIPISKLAKPATVASASERAKELVVPAVIELPTTGKAVAYSTVTGRVSAIRVEHGETVRAGQVLAEVESVELRKLELDLLQARVRERLARTGLERLRRLVAEGAGAEKDLWQFETDAENLQTTVDSLKNRLSLLGLSEEDIRKIEAIDVGGSTATDGVPTVFQVRAPMDGRITDFKLSIGQVVNPQSELFEIQNLSQILVRGYVHEQDSATIAVGQPAEVQIVADPNFAVTAKILRTAPVLSSFGRTTTVWAQLDNASGRLKDGMLARMKIHTAPTPAQTAGPPASTPATKE
ncbi:MAG TPA: efflux RND transporter periplasmic adaptor subunit [Pirellulales bacterium]|jgi:cobalt-zinc-cadmium efflux system membrane fusion protein